MPLEPTLFRDALAHWASGVAVAACRDAGRVVATTISAFMSLSLEPPLILAAFGPNATIRPFLTPGIDFSLNVLSVSQRRLANIYADPFPVGPTPFEEADPPRIADALTILVCRVREARDAAQHLLVTAEVLDAHVRYDSAPLIRYARAYHELAR